MTWTRRLHDPGTCAACHPKPPRTDVSPPSSPPAEHSYDAGDVTPREPDRGDRAVVAARAVLVVMTLAIIAGAAAVLSTYFGAVS